MAERTVACLICEELAGYVDMFGDPWCLTHWLDKKASRVDGQWLCWRCGQPAPHFFGGQVTKLPGDPSVWRQIVSAYQGRRPFEVLGGVCLSCWEQAHGPWEAS